MHDYDGSLEQLAKESDSLRYTLDIHEHVTQLKFDM